MRAPFRRAIPVLSFVTCILCAARGESALVINLNPAAGISQNAIDGFQAAANYWQSVFMDDITVNLDVDFTSLDPGILGQTSSTDQVVTASSYLNALSSDASSADDAMAVAHLPSLTNGTYLAFQTQVSTESGSTTVSLDNNTNGQNANNNAYLDITTANAKAVGLFTGSSTAADGSITFSSDFSWDFNPSDGITAGQFDFIAVATHEIGHALGFISGVDIVDYAIGAHLNLDQYAVFSGLDMFRYSSNNGILDLAAGTNSYFSIDSGQTNLGLFSTGPNYGDGFQASHWKDNLGLGIMDPTLAPGEHGQATELDLRAFDVIGWDRVFANEPLPEPSSFMLLGLCGLAFGVRARRKKSQVAA